MQELWTCTLLVSKVERVEMWMSKSRERRYHKMKISHETIKKFQDLGYLLQFYDPRFNETFNPEKATELTVVILEEIGIYNIKPKKSEMSFQWIMDQIDKKRNYKSIDWRKVFQPLELHNVGFYVTSYGVGVEVIFGDRDGTIQKIKDFLTAKDIDFSNEYSDAGWVYRFKIGKSKENIDKINKLQNE